MKRKNGFTLIELLAIIVILAIIAVITVPIILGIIDNSKKGAAKNSAYGYKDAVNKLYITKLSTDPNYNIPDGTYSIGELGEQVEGQIPDSELSWFKIKKNEIIKGCLQFDEYKVKINNGKVETAEKGECEGDIYIPLTGELLDNIKSYDAMEIIYYNPIDGEIDCTDYDSDNSIPKYKGVVPETNTLGQTSCLKWYKYSTNKDGSINMILDHNTETNKQYYTSANNTYGPTNLMQYLELSEWEKVPARSDKYTAYVDNNETKTAKFTSIEGNAIDYTGMKARLITAQEVAEITGATATTSPGISWDEQKTSSSWFYVDSKSDSNSFPYTHEVSNYYWLFENLKDCESFGCKHQYQDIFEGNSGYWTSTPSANNTYRAWRVTSAGSLSENWNTNSYTGLRPVITIPAS